MRLFCLLPVALLACNGGGDEDALEIPDGPLQGVIGGEEWSADGAITNSFLSDEEGWFVEVKAAPLACDDYSGGGDDRTGLIVNIPTEEGEYEMSFSLNGTFVVDDGSSTVENLVATNGLIVVENIGADTVDVAMVMEFDSDNSVGGSFTFDICPESTY
jgi:hypothetical protein